ncbi:hypothetical protein [Mogibacterium pumilum]|uniref:Gram-positive cocci surface proteins LPxTG domain-containing protein n=1 Tax=Mogibacterium pumilum TaxID=86332 RepID=A0A223AQX5_9FIRM|nr:hypothetical protein [Mogibacterium pumilum]ASS37370.1 hypothetical protein AXF17_02050 [Mogibacterium pumilum]
MKNLARYVLSITLSVILVFSAMPSLAVHADDNQALAGAGKHPISKTPEGWQDLREILAFLLSGSFDNNEEKAKAEYEKLTRLDGDILLGTDTQHKEIKAVNINDTMNFTGTLKVDVIKKAVGMITPGVGAYAKLDGVSSQFVAEFVIPDGMIYSKKLTKDNVKLKNAKDIFEVTDVKVEGQKVTVTMDFVDPMLKKANKENKPYIVRDLNNALNKVNGQLEVTIPGVKFDKTKVKPGDVLTVKGTLSGNYKMQNLVTAHYDPRMRTLRNEYLKDPSKVEKFKNTMPTEYQDYQTQVTKLGQAVEDIQKLADEVKALRDEFNKFVADNKTVIDRYLNNDPYDKTLYENYSDDKNFEFPTSEPFKMMTDRLYNRTYQHDGHSDMDYGNKAANRPAKAYSLYGEINLLSNNIAKVPKLYNHWSRNISDEQKAKDKPVIDKLEEMLNRAREFGDNEKGRLHELASREFEARDAIVDMYIDSFALQELLTNPQYGGIRYDNVGASEYPKLFMGWDAVQSEAGRDSVLENDANADKTAIQLTVKVTDEKTKIPGKITKKKSPTTGDKTNLILYTLSILVALGAVVALTFVRKRKVR